LLDKYIVDKDIFTQHSFGGIKTAYINGEAPDHGSLPPGLEISKLNLQDYFIQLMNNENSNYKLFNKEG